MCRRSQVHQRRIHSSRGATDRPPRFSQPPRTSSRHCLSLTPPSSMSMHRSRVFVFFLHISRHLCSGDLRPVSPAGIQRSPQGISGNPARNRSDGTACRASRRSREARRAGPRRRSRADRAKPQGRRTGRRATLARGQAARHDPVPRAASNCALGGKDGRTLFVTAQKGVYSIDVEGARSR